MSKIEDIEENNSENNSLGDKVVHLSGMYENWFLDYASYVILERSVPYIEDGLKPVQRRILHSLKELDDGRYHKVANVIGHTMKYHPHGDASIGDAMVQIGNKNLLLDMQGNWGNVATGDRAAAPRYIEVRLSKFALEVAFNNKITEWITSYDGRTKEPVTLPIKFPLLLAHGVEGIAVGLSTKILPHNFNELIDASIKILKGIKPRIFPDFETGGTADFTDYNDGKRGGKVRVRARIIQQDKHTLNISEIPYSTTTTSLINSILKANDKGKIKIKKVEDNTSENVEILITLPSGVSPDKTIDALYSFTDCELTISPLSCIIYEDKPQFLGVSDILQISTNNTLDLLEKELQIRLNENNERWHFANLERVFIENRIYHQIEELTEWELVITTIHNGLKPFKSSFNRQITDDDVIRLTEIKIKRITKFDINKAKNDIVLLENRIAEIQDNLDNLVDYAITYFKDLKLKYGKDRNRKTEIRTFENIIAAKVVAANKRLYVNKKEGFIGSSLRKDEFVRECSDLDDIIVFRENGTFIVVKLDSKVFVGKGIIYCDVFKKKDDRTIYNMIYKDGKNSNSYVKRFAVTSVTRNKEYSLTKNIDASKVLYFTANPNGEAEVVSVLLRSLRKLKKLKFDFNFSEIAIKGRSSKGNILSKNPIKRIEFKSEGSSTLSARKIWYDQTVNRLNVDERGILLGEFNSNDRLLIINQKGYIIVTKPTLSMHFDDDMILIEKYEEKKPITTIYFNGEKQLFYVKRFHVENFENKYCIISSNRKSYLEYVTTDLVPMIKVVFVKEKGKDRKKLEINLKEFISIKGSKSIGNQLSSNKIKDIIILDSLDIQLEPVNLDTVDKQDNINTSDEGAKQISLDL